MADNDIQNCYYPVTPYVYPTTISTYQFYPYYNTVDQYKIQAMRLALEAKPGRPFKEVIKLAAQIEEYLRG